VTKAYWAHRLKFGAIVAACLSCIGTPAVDSVRSPKIPENTGRRPDIVLVTIDALRADHLSAFGYSSLTSPAIDRIARESVVFSHAITQAPYTKAAVASLMSGLYPSAHKTITATVPIAEAMTGHPVSTPVSTDVLSSSLTTLAEALHAAGYRTLGFTANPFLIAPFGFGRGFDVFEFFPGDDFAGADRMVDRALDLVEPLGPEPIFLWLHLMEPHSPYIPPAWARGMFPLRGEEHPIPPTTQIPPWLLPGSPRDLRLYQVSYDAEIAAADVAVDVLLRNFNDIRDEENAVVVLTADHGEQFLDHGGLEHNDTLYDELIHIPLVVKAPGVRPRIAAEQVQLLDLFPTLLEFGGAEVPAGTSGRDLHGLLTTPGTSRPAFAEIAGVQAAVREDNWKLIRWVDGRKQLFDLRHDVHELHDLSNDRTDETTRLRSILEAYLIAAEERSRSIVRERTPVDPNTAERLRALGYVSR
jgi:arylsulfatase A-like enzyme